MLKMPKPVRFCCPKFQETLRLALFCSGTGGIVFRRVFWLLRYPRAFFTPITFRNDRMPHSASAKKRLRQNVRSRDRNKAMKSEMKTSIRKVLEALSAKDVTAAKDLFKSVAKKADQAATAKTIHRNKAARIKSRLSARIVKAAQPAAS